MEDREKLYDSYKNLVQYKNKSKAELMAIIDKKISDEKNNLDLDGVFSDPEELKTAKKIAKKYLSQHEIESSAERNELRQLIWDEVRLDSVRKRINQKCNDMDKYIPEDELKVVDDFSKRIINRKKALGFFEKEKEENDAYKLFETLKKKAKAYWEKHQGTVSCFCPVREKMCLLKIRTDKYDCQEHPYFEDRILTNLHLMRLYCKGTVTAEDVAKILESSEDYIEWLIERWKNHPQYKEFIAEYREKKAIEDNEQMD